MESENRKESRGQDGILTKLPEGNEFIIVQANGVIRLTRLKPKRKRGQKMPGQRGTTE